MKNNRIDYLDSVRGIAAMMVVVYHFIGWRWEKLNSIHFASMVFNGSDAVSFFFVLSGFVLSFKYFQSNEEINLKEYITKRLFRIFPAYIFTVLLMYIYSNRHELGLNTLTDIFINNSQQLWQELYLVKSDHKFYIPGWTLGVEMTMSLLLPFLILAARKNIRFVFALIPISIYIGAGHLSMFTLHFCLGILLAYFYPQIQAFDFKQSKIYPYRLLIFLIVFVMYSIRHIDRIYPLGNKVGSFLGFWGVDFFHITGFASFIILLFIINNKTTQNILQLKPLLFLGKISYSIYLMHWIVVVYVMDHWEKWPNMFHSEKNAFIVMLIFTIAITLLLATMLFYFVEKPFIIKCKKYINKI